MTGVILAGGEGTRLRPVTYIYNKHLALVYDRPMIDYPLSTLRDMGCDEVILVTGGENVGGFADYLGDGRDSGLDITYRVQREAGGIGQALMCVSGLKGLFPVILGDNYYSEAPKMPDKPTLYTKEVEDARRFGVHLDGTIIEKPDIDGSGEAVTGLYVYDERVFDMLGDLEPSDRGELEITDINNKYLDLGADIVRLSCYWRDMGTFDSLLEVATWVHSTNNS